MLSSSTQSWWMECLELSSVVFFEIMYEDMELLSRTCAFMMRSMLVDQLYTDVVKTQKESANLVQTIFFSVLSSSTSFMSLVRGTCHFFILIAKLISKLPSPHFHSKTYIQTAISSFSQQNLYPNCHALSLNSKYIWGDHTSLHFISSWFTRAIRITKSKTT